ncbi:hypothetical protein J2Y45_003802 [Dyadobacter sp. BE34]|uniref:Uncharacterized protein n=1 Tax=Dyadobacter fermentans TaxID=94254 RepID=A0ABU1QZR3_9BACT|nr:MULTISPECIES: hypothetical protein [Dyadobacter]MDR6806610.1 hypothetical protein [Dyadobacter fermentans]MDR7044352.1 hypothetical protein [Dyadobacter sp. BE242]MDR7198662.1 hypothetical protein [Dyadobacter sp. BE34]MDR7216624.1 hypothetical protein [Dyadobacter sp. BE31]MDR7263850.1 hypothetical protein [Dyadobacter sp. BE32]
MKELLKELLPMKWYFVYVAALLAWLAYANLYGDRILSFDSQEEWSSGGRSSHRSGIMHHK